MLPVSLARASAAAYWPSNEVVAWALREGGFTKSKFFDSGNVQGYWCTTDDVAMLTFRGTSNPGQWLRDARFFSGTARLGSHSHRLSARPANRRRRRGPLRQRIACQDGDWWRSSRPPSTTSIRSEEP
jgi:hypothetical protein